MPTRLGDLRCSQLAEEDVVLLSAITQLSDRTVRRRLATTRGNMLVCNAFEAEWPIERDQLVGLTVANARRAWLDLEIAAISGLGKRAVGNRLTNTQGKTLIVNAFPEIEDADDELDEEEGEEDYEAGAAQTGRAKYEDAKVRFSALDLLGRVRVISVRSAQDFAEWLAGALDVGVAVVKRRLKNAHGRTVLCNAFANQWPPKRVGTLGPELLGRLTVGSARRSASLVRLVADQAKLPPREVFERVEAAQGNTRVDTVVPELDGLRVRPPTRPATQDRRGEEVVVSGQYVLGPLLGQGKFGRVFLAKDRHPPFREVALKFVKNVDVLTAEAKISDQLNHVNICAFRGSGVDPRLGNYLVMQFGGESLDRIIEREGSLDLDVALEILEQAARGLTFALENQIFHNDVKPSNILVKSAANGLEVRVADFGLAQVAEAEVNTQGAKTLMASHSPGWTRPYAAPEQLQGARYRRRADQYSLALVFCSMLEGRVFVEHYQPREFGRLSKGQNHALACALSLEPRQRFETSSDFARAMRGR